MKGLARIVGAGAVVGIVGYVLDSQWRTSAEIIRAAGSASSSAMRAALGDPVTCWPCDHRRPVRPSGDPNCWVCRAGGLGLPVERHPEDCELRR